MVFHSLTSSSLGNACLISDGENCLLLECGLPYAKLSKLARQNGVSLPQITACLVTHEHKDHALSADKLLSNGIPVYASEGMARVLNLPDMEIIEPHDTLCFGALRVLTILFEDIDPFYHAQHVVPQPFSDCFDNLYGFQFFDIADGSSVGFQRWVAAVPFYGTIG